MYFMVENTPESVKNQRRDATSEPELVEERPCLSLAPFSRAPLLLFENVPIGSCAERCLDIVNPTKKTIQLSLGRAPPPGLVVCFPETPLELGPHQAYSMVLRWTPLQPTSQRETVHFTDQFRGRYEVIFVLKTVVVKPTKKLKSCKSPQKKKIGICSPNPRVSKPTKKISPKLMTKKKSFYQTNTIQQLVSDTLVSAAQAPAPSRMFSNKENRLTEFKETSTQKGKVCPFESLASLSSADSFNLNMTTSDIFGMRGKENFDCLSGIHKLNFEDTYTPKMSTQHRRGVLSPSTRFNTDIANAIDNLTFTPLKNVPTVKVTPAPSLEHQKQYECEFVDSIETDKDKKIDNETHSIIMIKSHDENDFNTHFVLPGASGNRPVEFSFSVESSIQRQKIPNTSSPKQYNSPGINFTMNTEFSHITDTTFLPQRCSTEKKISFNKGYHDGNMMETPEGAEKQSHNITSDTYTKPDCSLLSLGSYLPRQDSPPHVQQPVQIVKQSYSNQRYLEFNERVPQKSTGRFNRNSADGIRGIIEANLWQTEKSPPRSITPPLQSIPEESTQFSMSHVDRTNPAFSTFTIDRTFEKQRESFSKPRDSISSWQKKSVRCEPTLWKKPARIKEIIVKQDTAAIQAITDNVNNLTTHSALHHIADVYTQASTVDPFLSSTYFYDEEAVDKFEKEFKCWLNYILTPPADLESNLDETKVDVGKIWTENRHKDIPAAPTKEQVSSQYHNNHRLESVRKSARALMLSPNMVEVYKKLNAQIDKKLISMRPDRNLPMDVGLQKIITELLLCYNPLWLRIGLETLYGTVIPLTSNIDVFGLTTFIIQRFFKDPYAKSKHSHPHVPNMLLPSYMEYMRKFTLKKFFMLIFFLDQAKQKKLMFHDPCLFCRNAQYKESRELLIQFTKEVIAGIGDITRHLRPLGYVVSHKQSFIDEYKYAVHNLAVDLKDGIRLTRVMEIILVKPGLMSLMRTPPVSRLQKIHNVQVALNALKDTNFNIVGDITPKDIADGHREKTLSLLWQIIHVFRAPLFEKASNVIQMWWRKKYLGVVIKKRIEHKKEMRKYNAASVIQCWWRKIQYQRLVEKNMKELQAASVIVQKYWRMWLCRRKYLKTKWAVRKVEMWYMSAKEKKQADEILRLLLLQQRSVARIQLWYRRLVRIRQIITLRNLYVEYCKETRVQIQAANTIKHFLKQVKVLREFREIVRQIMEINRVEKLRNAAATKIQSYWRGWSNRKKYSSMRMNVIKCQATVRRFLTLKRQARLLHCVVYVQRNYKNKLLMVKVRSGYEKMKKAAVVLQTRYRAQRAMQIQRKHFENLKTSAVKIEHRYKALIEMRKQRQDYLKLKKSAIVIQKNYRMKLAQQNYQNARTLIIAMQQKFKAKLAMKKQRLVFTTIKKSAAVIQTRFRSYLQMKEHKETYLKMRIAAVKIQTFVRKNKAMKLAKENYLQLKKVAIILQRRYRARLSMKVTREEYMKRRLACITVQVRYRALVSMRLQKANYQQLKASAIVVQRRYRANKCMKLAQQNFQEIKKSCAIIQEHFRAYVKGKQQRNSYLILKKMVVKIQRRFREKKLAQRTLEQFVELKVACLCIQRRFRAKRQMKQEREEYLKLKQSTLLVQTLYRAKLLRRQCEMRYTALKHACVTIQHLYRAKLAMRIQRDKYRALKRATVTLQERFRAKKVMETNRKQYLQLKAAATVLQRMYRARREMIKRRNEYLALTESAVAIQRRYRARLAMKKCSQEYNKLKQSIIAVQNRFRANQLMKNTREQYLKGKSAANKIKGWYKACKAMRNQRHEYLLLVGATIIIQRRFRALRSMRKMREEYTHLKRFVVIVQQRYRAKKIGEIERREYLVVRTSITKIQKWYRSVLQMRRDKHNLMQMKELKLRNEAALKIQVWYLSTVAMKNQRDNYLKLRKTSIKIQALYRMFIIRRQYIKMRSAAVSIQTMYRSYQLMRVERLRYIAMKTAAIKIQSMWKCWKTRQTYIRLLSAIRTIQITYRRRKWLQDMRESLKRRTEAAICIQSNFRRYICMTQYQLYRSKLIFVQRRWREKILMRTHKKNTKAMLNTIVKVQTLARGYLARRQIQRLREESKKQNEEKRQHLAASKIQALFRGNRVREQMKHHPAVAEIRQKLNRFEPSQSEDTIKYQNEYALDVLTHYRDIPSIIRAFVIIEYLTEVYPMIYHKTCNRVAVSLLNYMMITNRSVSTLDTVRPAAAILVNMARYKHTALVIYSREKMANILKLILRWSGQDSKYYCALCTFMWLFGKYDHLRKDLSEFLQEPDNRNLMHLIRAGVLRKQRMKENTIKFKTYTPKPVKCAPRHSHTMNASCRPDCGAATGLPLPALEPDYGFKRVDKPRYFENDLHAIDSLFTMYGIPLK